MADHRFDDEGGGGVRVNVAHGVSHDAVALGPHREIVAFTSATRVSRGDVREQFEELMPSIRAFLGETERRLCVSLFDGFIQISEEGVSRLTTARIAQGSSPRKAALGVGKDLFG